MRRDHAVVIGASMAGLLAARVLSDHFTRVTVIERDTLPDAESFRAGVPQSRHTHGLLARGARILTMLFPDFERDLDARNIPHTEWLQDTIQLLPSGWTPRFKSGLYSRPISRLALEALIRRRVKAIANIDFCEGMQVTDVIAEGRRVIGLKIEPRRRGSTVPADSLRADLIVDASGRSSKTPEWLAAFGYKPPSETSINSHLGYATRMFRLPPDALPDWKAVFMLTSRAVPKGGVFTLVEDDLWMLTLAGIGDAKPPTDEDGLATFIADLPLPPLHQALRRAEPVSPIYGYQRTANQLRHYERVTMPPGLIAIGDAVSAFNPIYGQGMSVAAMGALTLDQALRGRFDETVFQKRLARSNSGAWLMATSEDVRYPVTEIAGDGLSPLIPLANRYLDVLFAAAPRSQTVTKALLETMHLLREPTSLAAPDVLLDLLRAPFRRPAAPPLS